EGQRKGTPAAGAEGPAKPHESEASERHAVQQLDHDETAPPQTDVHLRRRERQKAASLVEQHDLGGDDDDEPHDSVEGRRPEHGGDGEQRIECGHGDSRAELVAHEHRQQLVLELRLDAGSGGEPGARRLEILGGAALRVTPVAAPRNLIGYDAVGHVATYPRVAVKEANPKLEGQSLDDFLTKCLSKHSWNSMVAAS